MTQRPASGMTRQERVLATLRGEPVDRPAYSFWRHFYDAEYDLGRHVASMLWWQEQVQNDFLKLQPRVSYFSEGWGTVFEYPDAGVRVGGGRPAPARDDRVVSFSPAPTGVKPPVRVDYPVKSVEDWGKLRALPPDEGSLGERLLALRRLRDALPQDVLLLEPIFNPLSIAANLTGGDAQMLQFIRQQPQAVHRALEVITETLVPFVRACLQAGAAGIQLSTTLWATYDRLADAEYAEFGRPYDLRVLEAVAAAPFNLMHVCQNHCMLSPLADYPVHAFNWAVYGPGNPSLAEARPRLGDKAIVGGISQAALAEAAPERAMAEARSGHKETGGRRWMAGPECTVPNASPIANMAAVGRLLREGDL